MEIIPAGGDNALPGGEMKSELKKIFKISVRGEESSLPAYGGVGPLFPELPVVRLKSAFDGSKQKSHIRIHLCGIPHTSISSI
jgi:hypothetical protein